MTHSLDSWDAPNLFDVDVRRSALIDWLLDEPRTAERGLTVAEIVDGSRLYELMTNGRYDRCLSDLKALARMRVVSRAGGRPARWRVGQPAAAC